MKYEKAFGNGDIRIDFREVLRYLAYHREEGDVPSWLRELIEQQMEYAGSLYEPWAIYSFLENKTLRDHPVFEDSEKIVFGMCTIGGRLDEAVTSLYREGKYTEWVVLDAIGTAAVEQVAKTGDAEIRARASQLGFRVSRKFSPGSGNWRLEDQRLVFGHFRDSPLKIRLNEAGMMDPKKSTSFAFKLNPGDGEETEREDCLYCNFRGKCAYRKRGEEGQEESCPER